MQKKIYLSMQKKCYICGQPSTSVEHVPPKCIFPEQKDLPDGIFLRKELITVPSCDLHNTAKCSDDEYLLYILASNISNNLVAFRQFSTKIMRSLHRRPNLMREITNNSEQVFAVDSAGTAMNALKITYGNTVRLKNCFNNIARALFLVEYKKRYEGGELKFLHDVSSDIDPTFKVVVSHKGKEISALEHVKNTFKGKPFKGENKSVFCYRFEPPDNLGLIALHMRFYGGSNVFAVFSPNGCKINA